ncbi:hypothetical protein PL373_04400 [Tenacibaculum maritimum]|nr:hypothetical protein [Tenacibaculum maritimum]MDB0600395.1 hypothetical protein [Tenacibaculum maritimum]MDB0610550.1 hypothetical protein [Tenacibaculum maritimum]
MKDKFYYSDSSNSFIGEIQISNEDIEFEINLNESKLNWEEIKNFISSFDNDDFIKIKSIASELLLDFIKLVPFGLEEPYDNYEFKLEGVSYYGKVNNLIFSEMVDSYELIFKIYLPTSCIECYDPYGNYIVSVMNKLITGVRREQI